MRRSEEETGNLGRVLDEQRAGMEERDNLIRQLRSNQVSLLVPSGTIIRAYEKLILLNNFILLSFYKFKCNGRVWLFRTV